MLCEEEEEEEEDLKRKIFYIERYKDNWIVVHLLIIDYYFFFQEKNIMNVNHLISSCKFNIINIKIYIYINKGKIIIIMKL